MVFLDSPVPSEAPSGATAPGTAIELVWVAADPDRAFVTLHRGARWGLRAVLFVSPASGFAALFVCLRGCLLAIVFVLWDPHRPSRCLHHHKTGGWSKGGRRPRRGRSTWPAMLAVPGIRAKSVAGQRFSAAQQASPNAATRCRSVRRVNPAKSAGAVAPWRYWHWSNCAFK
jgi:hypothetical protein